MTSWQFHLSFDTTTFYLAHRPFLFKPNLFFKNDVSLRSILETLCCQAVYYLSWWAVSWGDKGAQSLSTLLPFPMGAHLCSCATICHSLHWCITYLYFLPPKPPCMLLVLIGSKWVDCWNAPVNSTSSGKKINRALPWLYMPEGAPTVRWNIGTKNATFKTENAYLKSSSPGLVHFKMEWDSRYVINGQLWNVPWTECLYILTESPHPIHPLWQ